jgi:uncharacterized alpha/beta hydrolase family protein
LKRYTKTTNKRKESAQSYGKGRTALTMIYINGTKATKSDLDRLLKDLKNGKQRATAHTTKNGNLAIVTEF